MRKVLAPGAPIGRDYGEHASYWLRPVRVFPCRMYYCVIAFDMLARLRSDDEGAKSQILGDRLISDDFAKLNKCHLCS